MTLSHHVVEPPRNELGALMASSAYGEGVITTKWVAPQEQSNRIMGRFAPWVVELGVELIAVLSSLGRIMLLMRVLHVWRSCVMATPCARTWTGPPRGVSRKPDLFQG